MPAFDSQVKYISVPCGQDSIRIRYADSGEGIPILYLHGWGCSYNSFCPLMESMEEMGRQIAPDFPGFGASERPPSSWGTVEYADCLSAFIKQLELEPCILIGHSFGGRIAIRLAERAPEQLRGMVLIASAGIRFPLPLRKRIRIGSIRTAARWAERLLPKPVGGKIKSKLYDRIASRDYKEAGELRPIFVNVVREDLSELMPKMDVPVLLIWGADDRETPPRIGERMHELLPHSTYIEIPGFDHYSILDRGKHQVSHHIRRFIKEYAV